MAAHVAALGLDIDGTLTSADAAAVDRLLAHARATGADVHINTARPAPYCRQPTRTASIAPRDKHHCLVHPDPPTSKVQNMRRMQQMSGVRASRCNVLIDDRPENVDAVRRAGFSAVLVDARTGIDARAAGSAMRLVDECARAHRRRATVRLALIALIVALLLALLCV